MFPDDLKIARICLVMKKGGDTKVNNYRPKSVLPVLSKLFETVISDRLTSFS